MSKKLVCATVVLSFVAIAFVGCSLPTATTNNNNSNPTVSDTYGYSKSIDPALVGSWDLLSMYTDTLKTPNYATSTSSLQFTSTAFNSLNNVTNTSTPWLGTYTSTLYTIVPFANKGKIGYWYDYLNYEYYFGYYDYSVRDTLGGTYLLMRFSGTTAPAAVNFSDYLHPTSAEAYLVEAYKKRS